MIEFGRSLCGNLAAAERREWLVTNGLGGFASGTVAGTLTRRYHGLLIAALQPPLKRTLLATKIDEIVRYQDVAYELATNRWKDGYLAPRGFTLIERFALDGTTPVWHYALADALLEKCVWMEPGANTTYVRYRALRAAAPLELTLRVLVNWRDFHGNTHAGNRQMQVTSCPQGLRIDPNVTPAPVATAPVTLSEATEGSVVEGPSLRILSERGDATIENVWYRDFVLSEETARGLDDRDDNLCAGSFAVTLAPGGSVTFAAVARDGQRSFDCAPVGRFAQDDGGDGWGEAAWKRRVEYEAGIIAAWEKTADAADAAGAADAADAPAWVRQCVLAADQFVVVRPTVSDPDARSVIAGYHWFGDWGRDTMIALPGLTLTTGRPEVAKRVLTAFSGFVDGGMLPNCFPEAGETPEYNTVDAALWYVETAARYVEATGDRATLSALWPSLQNVIENYRTGTRYGIHMDGDGLIAAGVAGVQLTWMDAKIGDWVVTPRIGKPVEINALWYNALARMKELATLLGLPHDAYDRLAETARTGFERFWNPQTGYCFDVLDGPNGNDPTLRPNQIFAVALPHSPLAPERRRAVVDVCAAQLLTSNGLRTLAPADPRFVGRYGGSPRDRDAAYHQGTVWPWLLGPFAVAHARVYRDAALARSYLEPLTDQLYDAGLGSISEIADGGAPFTARGAIAQAWSVAELLHAWHEISRMAVAS